MIIRISRQEGEANPAWWAQAGRDAASGRAPHGIHHLILDPAITHVDVFATEAGEVWEWAKRFDGWTTNGRTQLRREPFDTLQSATSPITVDQIRALLPGRER